MACKVCDTMICRLKVLKLKRANEGITEIESSLINLFDVELEDLKEDQKEEEFVKYTLEKVQ